MKTSDFYYDLPQELIAQDPLEDRSSSRLMHLSLKDGSIEHRHFTFLRAKFAGRKTSGTIENNVLVHGGICGDLSCR